MNNHTEWNTEFDRWLEPFLRALGHKACQQTAPSYVRGLITPGDRKSIRPVSDRNAPGQHERIHHFVSTSTWNTTPLETLIAREVQRLVGGKDAVLIVDDTTLPKKGNHSVGIGHQYSGTVGKMTNCQCVTPRVRRTTSPSPSPSTRCPSRSHCGCSCRANGRTTPRGAIKLVSPSVIAPQKPKVRLHSRSWIGSEQQV
jgi:DDE superfamily endonuclease